MSTQRVNVVVAASPFEPSIGSMLEIAAYLVRCKHPVTMLTSPVYAPLIEPLGVTALPLPGLAAYDAVRRRVVEAGRRQVTGGLQRIDFELRKLVIEPMIDQYVGLRWALGRIDSPVTLVTDQHFAGHWPLRLGAEGNVPSRTVTIGTGPLTLASRDHAPFGVGRQAEPSADGRRRQEMAHRAHRRLLAQAQDALVAVIRDLGADAGKLPFVQDAPALLTDAYLQLAPADFDYPRRDAPPHLRFVGGLPRRMPTGVRPPWWFRLNTAERVVVVMATGDDAREFCRTAARAFADAPGVLVLIDGEWVPGVQQRNVIFADLSTTDFTGIVDVVITDAEYGACVRALSTGVPLVVVGDEEDRLETATRAVWTGAAVRVAGPLPGIEQLQSAVHAVLADPRRRDAARRIASANSRSDPLAEIAVAVRPSGVTRS